MPGIAGIITKTHEEHNPRDIGLMIESMNHEHFYTSGTYVDDRLGVSIGWVIIKGSFSDCMPVWNETNDVCLIFSGENYADSAVTSNLKALGHQFHASDASYLVHLYEEKGDEFFGQLNGWFAGLILDLRKGSTILFNDRIGMKRVYYHEDRDAFYFATEAKALLKVKAECRRMDPDGLGEYLSYGCVLNDKSLFTKIYQMPGGSAWRNGKDGVLRKGCYFHPRSLEERSPLGREAYFEKFKEAFRNVLPRYFSGKEPVGMSLTGGLDTRIIMAWADTSLNPLPCYTFGGMYRDSYDVKVAREVADTCGQSHEVIRVDRGFLSEFPKLAEKTVYLTDGGLGVGGAPELYVNSKAREIAPVRLTGNYGGEVMRGNVNFKPNPSLGRLLHDDWKKIVLNANQTYEEVRKGHPITFAVFKQAPWFNGNRLSLERSQLTLRSPFLDNDLIEIAYQAPAENKSSRELFLRIIAEGNPGLRGIRTDRGIGGNSGNLHSKIARTLLELMFKAEYIFDYGMPQWMTRIDNLLRPLHPERYFLGRHKFYHFRIWYRNELSGYIKNILLDDRTQHRPYWRRGVLKEIADGHLKRGRNFTTEIEKALTIELIHRLLIEQI